MKRFYLLLGAVAVAAGVFIWYGSRPRGGTATADIGAGIAVTPADSAWPGYVLGSQGAPVQIVEFADFECPFCAQFGAVQFPSIRQQLIATGRVRWAFKDFPLPSHQWSRMASHTIACADEQGKAWEAMDALFSRHGQWAQQPRNPDGLFHDLLRGVGVEMGRFDECMKSNRYAGRIEASRRAGEAAGVRGTPTFFVNGREYHGEVDSDSWARVVDSLTAGRK